jgi:hypothetical protein
MRSKDFQASVSVTSSFALDILPQPPLEKSGMIAWEERENIEKFHKMHEYIIDLYR